MTDEDKLAEKVEAVTLQEEKGAQEKGALSLEERFSLVRSVGEECIQEDELRMLLDKKPSVIAYDGFEPSGRMHIAQVVHGMKEHVVSCG